MLEGKKVTVVGLGTSGLEAAIFSQERKASVKVTDKNDNPEIRKRYAKLEEKGIECELARHTEEFMEGTELLVVSPGVDNNSLPIRWAEERKIPVISEIELGYQFCEGKIVAVSGTNGKSTVTSIIGEIIKKAGKNVFVCGNIGTPFTSIASSVTKDDIVVLEISSFQLERIERFRPHVAVMLNITEDHLDRYSNFNEYVSAKLRLFANQSNTDYAIVNYDQSKLKALDKAVNSNLLYFTKHKLPKEHGGAYVENNELVVRKDGRFIWFAAKDSLSLSGEHNLENALASGLAAFILGIEPDIIKDVLYNFKGLSHRFESVDTINGIRFVDDSKATNVDSARRAIQSSPKGIILIAGGKDKGGDYKILAKLLKEKVRSILLIGEASQRIRDALSNTVEIALADNLNKAVKTAFKMAKRGETVLLSPMCSSFDMFKDYKERGDLFRRAVEELKKDA